MTITNFRIGKDAGFGNWVNCLS